MSTPVTPYQRTFDYAGCFESEVWATADGHQWDRIAAIAAEHQRGERDWDATAALVDSIIAEITGEITLDYAEVTGLHLRVGLIAEHGGLEIRHDLAEIAYDLVGGGITNMWDVNHTSATTVELSFERDL